MALDLKIPNKTLDDNFNLKDFQDDFTLLGTSLDGVLNGEKGRNIKIVAGTVRNTGLGWSLIEDEAHKAVNVSSVSNTDTMVVINYDIGAKKTVSFIAGADETLALDGITVGASVNSSLANIRMVKNNNRKIGGYIYYDGTNWNISNTIGITSAQWESSSNSVVLNFSSTTNHLVSVDTRDGYYHPAIVSSSATTAKIRFFDYSGNAIATPDTKMKFYFNKATDGVNEIVNPNSYSNSVGNIWFIGVFEV